MEKNEKVQILNHTYDAIADVVFGKNYMDLNTAEKDIVEQMCE